MRAAVLLLDLQRATPNAVTVDTLARLQLAARRLGLEIRLQNAPPQLLELVDFMGLADVLVLER